MTREQKNCQNCKNQFTIEPEDFRFYEKMQVPSPTWCPECRAVRRMTWRNERSLYQRKCDATGKDIVSMFYPDMARVVYDRDYWWSDNWDQMASGREYDFSRPFFEQFRELMETAPLPNLFTNNAIGSPYANHCHDLKNGYLVYASRNSEEIFYSRGAGFCKDSMDLYVVDHGELCYGDILCANINRVHFSYDSDESLSCLFLKSCKNMQDSVGCVNLHHKSHHIFNHSFSREAYKKELKKLDFGSYVNLQSFRDKFREFSLRFPHKYASFINCENVSGDMIMLSSNCQLCFDIYGKVENSKFLIHATELRDSYDGFGTGINAELLYECIDTGKDAALCRFSIFTHACNDVHYTYSCHSSSDLFGCVGLRNKKYCILNKQYTENEYKKLVPKIIEYMNKQAYTDARGRVYRYGEFFPPEISPFAYNETIAQEYFSLTKDEIFARGYRFREPQERHQAVTKQAVELPDHIKDAPDSIAHELVGCEHGGGCTHQCTVAFKIIPTELAFYRKLSLPLPRLCPNCRHYERLAQRNPYKLWHRKCQCTGAQSENGVYKNTIAHFHVDSHCPNEFETAYAPERQEIVYCEACYKAEVI